MDLLEKLITGGLLKTDPDYMSFQNATKYSYLQHEDLNHAKRWAGKMIDPETCKEQHRMGPQPAEEEPRQEVSYSRKEDLLFLYQPESYMCT